MVVPFSQSLYDRRRQLAGAIQGNLYGGCSVALPHVEESYPPLRTLGILQKLVIAHRGAAHGCTILDQANQLIGARSGKILPLPAAWRVGINELIRIQTRKIDPRKRVKFVGERMGKRRRKEEGMS